MSCVFCDLILLLSVIYLSFVKSVWIKRANASSGENKEDSTSFKLFLIWSAKSLSTIIFINFDPLRFPSDFIYLFFFFFLLDHKLHDNLYYYLDWEFFFSLHGAMKNHMTVLFDLVYVRLNSLGAGYCFRHTSPAKGLIFRKKTQEYIFMYFKKRNIIWNIFS